MKLFVAVFFVLLSFYSYGESLIFDRQEGPSFMESHGVLFANEDSKKKLNELQSELKQYVDSLMLFLLNEEVSRETQMRILDELKSIAEVNGEITMALNQISQKGGECEKAETKEECAKAHDLWIKAQSELIRRKQSDLDELSKREKKLERDFWVSLAFDGVVITAGGILFFVPSGQALSMVLIGSRLTLTGKKLGAILAGTGVFESGLDIWNYFFDRRGEETLSIVSEVVIKDVFTRELVNILSSAVENKGDEYLAKNLSISQTEEELIGKLLSAVQRDEYSVFARQSVIRSLRAFSEMELALKLEAIGVLRSVIDESGIPELRETAVSALGEIGEGELPAVKYLTEIGKNENESNKMRLMALIQLGRSSDYFDISIDMLAGWFRDRNKNNEVPPLKVHLEIPDSFVDSLLVFEGHRVSEGHIAVLNEFIRLEILRPDLKIRFAETLLSWDSSVETKELLKRALTNPALDTALYVEELSEEMLSERNYQSFKFLKEEIEFLVGYLAEFFVGFESPEIPQEIVFGDLEGIIKDFKEAYPEQEEIRGRLESFISAYKKVREDLWN